MKSRYAISLVLIVMFISPVLSNPNSNLPSNDVFPSFPDGSSAYASSGPISGSGPSLSVSLLGVATDRYGGNLQIDASTTDIRTITLDDGLTG